VNPPIVIQIGRSPVSKTDSDNLTDRRFEAETPNVFQVEQLSNGRRRHDRDEKITNYRWLVLIVACYLLSFNSFANCLILMLNSVNSPPVLMAVKAIMEISNSKARMINYAAK